VQFRGHDFTHFGLFLIAPQALGGPATLGPLPLALPPNARFKISLKMVRAVGIEPTLLAEPDFESGASTSSTTPARSLHWPARQAGSNAVSAMNLRRKSSVEACFRSGNSPADRDSASSKAAETSLKTDLYHM
jgi:hypothetical protein